MTSTANPRTEALPPAELGEALLAANPIATAILRERRIVRCNRLFEQAFACGPGELDGTDIRELYANDADYERIGKAVYSALSAGTIGEFELELRRASGERFWGLLRGGPFNDGTAAGAAICTLIDITERRAREATHRFVDGAMPGALAYVDRDERVRYLSRSAEDLYGTRQADIGRTIREISRPEVYAEVAPHLRRVLAGESVTYRRSHARPDGAMREIHAHLWPDRGEDGVVRGYVGLFTDITELAAAQHEQAGSRARLLGQQKALARLTEARLLQAGSPGEFLRQVTESAAEVLGVGRVSLWRTDAELRAIVCDDLYEQAPVSHSGGSVLAARDYPRYFAALASRQIVDADDAHRDPRTSEFRDGYLRPLGIESMLDAPLVRDGVLVGVLCCEHVGPRRVWTADEKLFAAALANLAALAIESGMRFGVERELAILLENLPGYVYRCRNDAEWTLDFASAGVSALTGYDAEDFVLHRRIAFASLIHEEDRERVRRAAQAALDRREPFELEYRIRTRTGEERWLWERGQGVFSPAGELLHINGLIDDITARRTTDAALATQTERLRIAQQAARIIVLEWDLLADTINFSDSPEWLRGPLPESGRYPLYKDQVHVDDRPRFLAMRSRDIQEKEAQPFEYRIVRTDGVVLWIKSNQTVFLGPDGGVARVIAALQDVTWRKRAEDALRVVKERLDRSLAASGVVLWDADLRTGMVEHSEGWRHFFGDPQASLSIPAAELLALNPPEERETLQRLATETMTGRRDSYRLEHRLKIRGEWRWILTQGWVTERDPATGRSLRLGGTNLDITNRKLAEIALAESERRFQDLARASGDWFWESDAEGRLSWMSGSVERITGTPASWFLGKSAADIAAPGTDFSAEHWSMRRTARERREAYRDFRYRLSCPSGVFEISNSGVPCFDAEGAFAGYRGTTTDISRILQVEKEARGTAERLAAAIEELDTAVILTDAGDRIVVANRGFREAVQLDAGALLGQTYEEMLRRLAPSGMFLEAAGREEAWVTERLVQRRTGSANFEQQTTAGRWRMVNDRRLFDGSTITYSIDITGRKRTERALEAINVDLESRVALRTDELSRREAELRIVAEHIPAIVVHYDRDLVCRYANSHYAKLVGRTPEEIVGLGFEQIVGAELAARERARVERALAGEQLRFERVRHDGKGTLEATLVPYVTPEGERDGYFAFGVDITDRKRQEDALRESEARLRAVIDVLPTLIYCKDREGRYLMSNRANAATFGRTPEEMLGRSVKSTSISAHQARETDEAERLARETGEMQVAGDFRLRGPDGRERAFHCVRLPFRYSDEHPDAVLGVITEITDLIAAQAELTQLNRNLEQRVAARTADLAAANRELEAFGYSVSHDLRAPLRGMSGFAGILLEDHGEMLPTEARRLLQRIADAGVRMGGMIDGLLQLSRLARSAVTPSGVDLAALAREVWHDVTAEDPQRLVAFQCPERCLALCDPVLIRNVLQNLLGNAFKYTRRAPLARVEFGVLEGDQPCFFVRDNGAGFDMAYASRLFGVFQRLHGVDEFEGTGVGLATVRRIIERHGGRIWAEANPGEGASFQFTLGPQGPA